MGDLHARSHRPGLMLRLCAWLRGGKVVWLRDHRGEVYATYARTDPWGTVWAPVYWGTRVGHVVLLPDGTTAGTSSYVKEWRDDR